MYFNKYIKYKFKYLNLKTSYGGVKHINNSQQNIPDDTKLSIKDIVNLSKPEQRINPLSEEHTSEGFRKFLKYINTESEPIIYNNNDDECIIREYDLQELKKIVFNYNKLNKTKYKLVPTHLISELKQPMPIKKFNI